MKLKLFSLIKTGGILLVLITLCLPAAACDICGCANSGAYFGMMPRSEKSVAGLRYQYLHFNTHPESAVLNTEETFNVVEAFARFFPLKRVQVMAFVPYRMDKQVTSALTKRNDGLGDVSVMANYNVLNTLMDTPGTSSWIHTLLLGGGVKVPTGKFKYDENDYIQVANANFQPGTGSVDFMLNAFYTLNYGKWGLATNLTRKFNTTNSQDYRFGNQWFGTAELFRTFEAGKFTLTPTIGLYGEYAAHGRKDDVILDITGGKILNGAAGLNVFTGKWMLGVNAQTPVYQKSASGHVFAKERFLIQLGWLF